MQSGPGPGRAALFIIIGNNKRFLIGLPERIRFGWVLQMAKCSREGYVGESFVPTILSEVASSRG